MSKHRKIATSFWAKPIPFRNFDWQASFADDEPDDDGNMTVGHGATEREAILNLLSNIDDEEEYESQMAVVHLEMGRA